MNCKITENYFAVKARMTGINGNDDGCMIECKECPLSHWNSEKMRIAIHLKCFIPRKQLRLSKNGRTNTP